MKQISIELKLKNSTGVKKWQEASKCRLFHPDIILRLEDIVVRRYNTISRDPLSPSSSRTYSNPGGQRQMPNQHFFFSPPPLSLLLEVSTRFHEEYVGQADPFGIRAIHAASHISNV